jgi:hypothetical protein
VNEANIMRASILVFRPGEVFVAAAAGALTLAIVFLAVASGPANANPFFATKTGRTCASCHNPGQEMSGTQGLNNTGGNFLRAFRANPDRALRDFAAGANTNSGGNSSGGNCAAKFTCANNIAICYFRTFSNGQSRTFQVFGGRWERVRGFHRRDGYCMNGSGFPNPNCTRAPIKMESCN